MPSEIKVSSLVPVGSTSSCLLVEVDGFRILIDCGWTELFDVNDVSEIAAVMDRVDCILISLPDIYHLGTLPYLHGRGLIKCPIYATDAVHKMGQMFLYDIFQSRQCVEDFNIFSIDDVDAVFGAMKTIKYNQTIRFSGEKGEGLKATAVNSGHMIGGALWRIQKEDEEDIIVVKECNLRREVHLNSAAIDNFDRPHLLILDGRGLSAPVVKRKERDVELVNSISKSLMHGKNVLIVTDTAGRILEVSLMLEQVWLAQKGDLGQFPIVVLNHVSHHVVTFAKSLVEWMSDKISKSFQATQANPFNFSRIKFVQSLQEVDTLPNPKVVLASQHDLECGFALELFMRWAPLTSTTVILSRRAADGSLTQRLLADLKQTNVSVKRKRRIPLEGAELELFLENKRLEQEALALKMQEVKEEEELIQEAVFEDERESFLTTTPDNKATSDKKLHAQTSDTTAAGVAGGRSSSSKPGSYFEEAQELRIRPLGWIEHTLLRPGAKPNPLYPFIAPDESRTNDDLGMEYNVDELKQRVAHFGRETRMLLGGDDLFLPPPAQHDDNDNNLNAEPDADDQIAAAAAAAESKEIIPTKCVEHVMQVDINATLIFIDCEGRCDSASLLKDQNCLLKRIIPRRLLIFNVMLDDAVARRNVEQFCTASEEFRQRGTKLSFVENIAQPVDCSSEANIYRAKLHPSLLRELQWQPLGRLIEIAPVLAQVKYAHASQPTVMQDEPTSPTSRSSKLQQQQFQQEQELPYLYPAVRFNPYAPPNGQPPTRCFHDATLRNLRKALIQNGVLAEFLRGALVCNDKVVVMKTALGKLHIQGPFSAEYLRIRQIIYDYVGVF